MREKKNCDTKSKKRERRIKEERTDKKKSRIYTRVTCKRKGTVSCNALLPLSFFTENDLERKGKQ